MMMMISSSRRFLSSRALRQNPTRLLRKLTTNATYYDSQSGLHVPVHDEQEISVFYNARKDGTIPDSLKALKNYPTVVHGLILPRDDENIDMQSLLENSPDGFQLFSRFEPNEGKFENNVSLMVDYDPNNPEEKKEQLQSLCQNGWSTMITLGKECFAGTHEPIMVANDVAALIDATKSGNFVWISNNDGETLEDGEGVVQLCEELQYLDLPGKTVKARLVVDVMNEDVVGETMMQGVNKFVVTEKSQIAAVQTIAEEQGKSLLLKK